MAERDREKYLEAYYDNEADANRQMSFANAAAAVYMLGIWICYLVGFFKVHSNVTLILINVAFPIGILVLLSPLLYAFKFKKELRKPNYKFFVLGSFIFVIAVLNVILPKHSAIAWALCILMANHYYNTKVGRWLFIIVVASSLFAMFGGMFVGEFDANLLFGNEIMENINTQEIYANGPAGRFEMLNKLYAMGNGFFDLDYNRYLGSVVFYFFPRSLILLLIFLASNALNKRTYKLLISEINVNSEQQKMSTELDVAKQIQLETLPSNVVTTKDVRIVAELVAAKEVGGDFYDYIQIDDDHIAIVIGDVSGKGLPAAMFMMKTITCFKNLISIEKTPSQVLKEVNAAIYDGNKSQMFVTCFFAILNIKTGVLKYSNAGHNPPVVGSNGNYRYLKCKAGFILGGYSLCFCQDEETVLQKGESITLYTDGITEARDNAGGLYGEDRLISIMNARQYYSVIEMHHSIKDDVAKFVNGADQSDDMTMITLLYHGDRCEISEKVFDCRMENLPDMLALLRTFCDEQNLDKDFKRNLLIVGDELFSNIIKHGYKGEGGPMTVRLLYNLDKKEFVMSIIDKAPEFNQLEVNNTPVHGNPKDIPIGGLGILIVKQIMTECAYDRINKKNILVLRKNF